MGGLQAARWLSLLLRILVPKPFWIALEENNFRLALLSFSGGSVFCEVVLVIMWNNVGV